MLAWRFVGPAGTPADGPLPADGEWQSFEGPLEYARRGMHGASSPLKALELATGPVALRLELRGELTAGAHYTLGRQRRVLWRADATDILLGFSRAEALAVADMWSAPEVVRRQLIEPTDAHAAEAFQAALGNGTPAAYAAMHAMGARESAWTDSWPALLAATQARAARRLGHTDESARESPDWARVLADEQQAMDARLVAALEALAGASAAERSK